MFKLFRYFTKKHWIIIGTILLITIGQAYLELLLPALTRQIIEAISRNLSGVVDTNQSIWIIGTQMILISIGAVFLMLCASFLASRLSASLGATIRKKVYEKVDSFSKEDLNTFKISSLITRTTNDVTQVQMVIMMMFRMFLVAPIIIIIALIRVIGLARTPVWDLTYNVLIGVGLLAFMIITIFLIVMPKFKKLQQNLDDLNQITKENLTGVRVIRAYNACDYQKVKSDNVNETIRQTNTFVNVGMSFFWPGLNMIFRFMNLSFTLVGIYLISRGYLIGANMDYTAGLGTINEFAQYSNQIFMSVMMMSMMLIMFPRGQVSAKRINEVLERVASISDENASITYEQLINNNTSPLISFNNVSFKYPNAVSYVLKDISFNAYAGQTVAFIGSTGSGKSTLINLIPRFFDTTEGQILVNNFDIKDVKMNELRKLIGYVSQKGFIFNDTIKNNMKIANENASDAKIWESLEVAQASFVKDYENGIDYKIVQGAKNVSGGQKQRLSIARAIVKDPLIYIFDDSFSALDYKTDKLVRNALKKHTQNSLVLIVSQRIGTVLNADKIVLLDEGEIVAIGTHKELIEKSKTYQDLAYSQLSAEELKNAAA